MSRKWQKVEQSLNRFEVEGYPIAQVDLRVGNNTQQLPED